MHVAVRDGALKYMAHREPTGVEEHLIDPATDMREQQDLGEAQSGEFRRLKTRCNTWGEEIRRHRR